MFQKAYHTNTQSFIEQDAGGRILRAAFSGNIALVEFDLQLASGLYFPTQGMSTVYEQDEKSHEGT